MRKLLSVVAFALAVGACSRGSVNAPTPVETPSLSESATLTSQAYDPKLKQKIQFSVEGEYVVARFRMPYNEDIGYVWLLVFDRGHDPQSFINAERFLITGPQGKDYELQVRVGKVGCHRPLQADLYVSDTLTEAMKNNRFHPSLLLGAATDLKGSDCPEPKPTPTPDPCYDRSNEDGPNPCPTPSPSPSPSPEPKCEDLFGESVFESSVTKTVTNFLGNACTPGQLLCRNFLSLRVDGTFSISAGKGGVYLAEIVYNPDSSNFVKKSKTVELSCGQSLQDGLSWGMGDQFNGSPNYSSSDGHVTGSYSLRVTKQ